MMMEAKMAAKLQIPTWIDSEKIGRKQGRGSLRLPRRLRGEDNLNSTAHLQPNKTWNPLRRSISLELSCSYNNFPAKTLGFESFQAPPDEALILRNKAKEIEQDLSGRCIYLVGMMGSGKTTVGKVLSQVLGFSFVDSDKLVEEAVNGTSVAEIFKLYGEGFFRDRETEALRQLSLLNRLVVSTGGGVVMRPINWGYMQKGISVWLDVPLEALAQRIAAVGTHSRPLLHHESGDPYRKALMRLSTLFEERGHAYAIANARVSLENIAAKLGQGDVCNLTPTTIAIEALDEIKSCLIKSG
ncbi:SKI domain-containing protein [Cephalotus follicularis]|uniref:shikimate kinase n=1 Tax=Cephalotus follicularis TaxID=3775 RepID=A0A1Q3AP58_CEPFO|nr:SKI domain-containing protein [Cephalotus follicularis]